MRSLLAFFVISFLFVSCSKNKEPQNNNETKKDKSSFEWKENLSESDIPDFNAKGFINGKELTFDYINFERWHGVNDNVLNFSKTKPSQPCGFVDNFEGFQIMNKGGDLKNFTKSTSQEPGTYKAFYRQTITGINSVTSNSAWSCILNIENVSSKTVTGKIALCFNDEKKSWIAGRFEATICNN